MNGLGIACPPAEAERFEDFCHKHLAHLDEVTWEHFGTTEAKDAVRQKVAALFPTHEVEAFTELFWNRIQVWRMDSGGGPRIAVPPSMPSTREIVPERD